MKNENLSLKEGKNKNKYFCKEHSDKKIKFYCSEEETFLCLKCLPKHFSHGDKTKEISPVELGNSIKELKSDLEKLNELQSELISQQRKNEEEEKQQIEFKKKDLI